LNQGSSVHKTPTAADMRAQQASTVSNVESCGMGKNKASCASGECRDSKTIDQKLGQSSDMGMSGLASKQENVSGHDNSNIQRKI
jgi:hypothetical protein